MFERKSTTLVWYVATNIIILTILLAHAFFEQKKATSHLVNQMKIVNELQLTDLSLFTDARYTRHLSMADFNTAFQDHPLAFEHFPSGTLVMPPHHLTNNGLD